MTQASAASAGLAGLFLLELYHAQDGTASKGQRDPDRALKGHRRFSKHALTLPLTIVERSHGTHPAATRRTHRSDRLPDSMRRLTYRSRKRTVLRLEAVLPHTARARRQDRLRQPRGEAHLPPGQTVARVGNRPSGAGDNGLEGQP